MSTPRDVSGIALPPNVRWDRSSQPVECPHCGRATPRTQALFRGKWIRFLPYPCDCPGYRAKVAGIERREAERRAASLPSVEVPERFAASVGEVDAEAMAGTIEAGCGIYLHGPNGTGKTTAAYAVAGALSAKGWRVEVTTVARIQSELADTWGGSETQEALFRRLSGCDLLVIDDLGKERPTEAMGSLLFRVVNDRYEREGALMVTSNYARNLMAGRLMQGCDEGTARSIASRLVEMTAPVEMGGDDRRLSNGKR